MFSRINGCMGVCMDVMWMEGKMDGCMSGWNDWWLEKEISENMDACKH